ncbi:cobalamin biosynthesis protein [Actinocorallia longicatena]|uniref:Cobalamin biosynthesis protein CobD n=1 Tax=Actinocorallia longicatena TaxID=111803 RepID=A0ABP6QMI4_9ACTN
MRIPTSRTRSAGLALGAAADAVFADPRRFHPVAGFGRAASALERRLYADGRGRGALFTGIAVGTAVATGIGIERLSRRHPVAHTLATAAATWTVLGGTSLLREAARMAGHLESGDLREARARLSHLCARDPAGLDAAGLARATVESVAENTSDAAVAPLFWGAVAGVPGLLGYRAINTLDAMVGYRSPRHLRFGWASARLDDAVNLLPARLTGHLTVAAAFSVAAPGTLGSTAAAAYRVMRRDAARHPSPNAGHCEAAAAGALGVRLGGANTYHGATEHRPALGDGPAPGVPDLRRAARLSATVTALAAVAAAGAALIVRDAVGE